jgi:sugar lactone lactonase YvrE
MMLLLLACAPDDPPAADDTGLSCESGDICTVAGNGIAGLGKEDVPATESMLYLPQDVSFSADGTPHLLDWNNHRIRAILPNGTIETVAGDGMIGDGPQGPALEARFNHPTNLAFDSRGRMTIAAWHNSRVEQVDFTTGELTWIAGDGSRSFAGDGGPATTAKLDLPSSVAYASDGKLYVSDQANQRIRCIDVDGTITTIAGNGTPGYAGDGGPATDAELYASIGQAAAPANKITISPDQKLYIADTDNHRIRVIDLATGIIDTFAGSGEPGYAGDGGPAKDAKIWGPTDVAVGLSGEVYFTDTQNNCVRVVTPDGMIDSFAGECGGPGFEGDGGPALEAALDTPFGVSVSPDGEVWIADTYNQRLRVVLP